MRRSLGSLLVVAGLVFMAWPVATWLYGLDWQERLARSVPQAEPAEAPRPASARQGTPPSTKQGGVAMLLPVSTSAKQAKAKPEKMPHLRRGVSFARIRIQRIRLDAMVVEGIDNASLRRGPGHLPKSGLPGESRNCAIAAHRDAWFRRLPEVRAGDAVWVETPNSSYQYVVEEKKVVTPDRGDLLNRGANLILTLITCTGPGYPNSKYRLLVFCRLRGEYPALTQTERLPRRRSPG